MTANVSTMPVHIADWISRIKSGKNHLPMKIKHLVEKSDWDREILAGEKWIDSCCWSVLGLSAFFFAIVCLSMLFR
jgi:hypothetical protein